MNRSADIVIIGGGIIGSSLAYYLAQRGVRDVVVLERDYISSGSTGRCGAGVRQQWGMEMNCRLSKGSVDIFEELSDELDMDIEFRQGGYLVLIENENQIEQMTKNITLQNSLGIPSKMISNEEAREIVPYLRPDSYIKATFCQTDGHANPFLTNFAYARAAKRMGATFLRGTEAKEIVFDGDRIVGVKTADEVIHTNAVVNAAGGYSHEVAQMAGIDLPTYSERHQILVTEPLASLFDAMVISFVSGIYLQQVPHGSFVLGIGEKEDPSYNTRSTWEFLETVSRELVSILPIMEKVRIVRQWAGLYNKTPDCQPIVGEYEGLPGFYNAVGFSGHGFMLAPMTSTILAQIICGEEPSIDISALSATRFARGELVLEPSVVG